MKKQFVLFISILAAMFLLSVIYPFELKADAKDREYNEMSYEIYPNPQQIEYGEDLLSLEGEFEVIYDDTIDDVTKEKVKEIFDRHGLAVPEVVKDPSKDKVTLMVGTAKSSGNASAFAAVDIDLDQIDAYELRIEKDKITVMGKDTDASFYGLVSLDAILNQAENNRVRNVHIKDFANSSVRGFIEGFYGVPWSNEDRMELMRFGGEHKMNAYIFAPKDDPYHNEKWREAYPDEKIKEIAEMAEVGKESKNQFVWMIHPFMNDPVRFDEHYDEDLQAIITKFEQLYNVGVRQFGVLADDIDLHAESAQNQLKLMSDLYEWNEGKDGTYNLMFTPSIYNYEWVSGNERYFDVMNELPADVHVMWTGEEVMGFVEQKTVDHFQQLMSGNENKDVRNPLFWLNWPVNDNNAKRLTIGKSEVMDEGVTNLDGLITNPMQQAEASKGALFTIADYAWNTDDFDVDENWEDSFSYIEDNVPNSLRTLAKHLNDQSPNIQETVYEESEDMKDLLEDYLTALDDETVTIDQINELMESYQVIIDAAIDVKENAANMRYVNEVKPWIDSLRDVAKATIFYLEAQKLYMEDEVGRAKIEFEKGEKRQDDSENHMVQNLESLDAVESGAKRLVPFMKALHKNLSAPTVDFDVSNNFVMVDEEIEVSNLSTVNGEEIEWDFPGAKVIDDSKENPIVSYPKEGRYTIKLFGKNSKGKSELIKEDFITVSSIAENSPENLALNKEVEVSSVCAPSESGSNAVDGNMESKWCANASGDHFIIIDLEKQNLITSIKIQHAEAGGEQKVSNTRDYTLAVSDDGNDFKTVADVKDNVDGTTKDYIKAQEARYVKLTITKPTQTVDHAARIFEIEVNGYEGRYDLPASYVEDESKDDDENDNDNENENDDGSGKENTEVDEGNKDNDENEDMENPNDNETEDGVGNNKDNTINGESLPKTATNMFNLLIGGIIFLLFGAVVYFIGKRKRGFN